MTIQEKVNKDKEILKGFQDHRDLNSWAKAQGMDNAMSFSKFKKALLNIDVDYNAMRNKYLDERSKKKQEELEKKASGYKNIVLYSDAKASRGTFAVCDQQGEVVWSGSFGDFGPFEQSACELEAAKKAVWLAKKAYQMQDLEGVNLTLRVDAKWLTYANAVKRGKVYGGKARTLGYLAEGYQINLTVEHIAGVHNPADAFTMSEDYERWEDHIEQIELV